MLEYAGILILSLLALLAVGGILLVNSLLGPKNKNSERKSMPFECGVTPFRLPEGRYTIKFYVIAMLFVVFDVEIIFLYAWAVIFRDLGWAGFAAMLVFLLVLAGGLLYAWRKGALDWK
jgi:NADH-quinone oxidoreductase subunit A